ncbi:uncharacterized protein C2845_PM04G19910 [Panicum miliaceum]|uniref:Uncharacterized protein n=2 Tax=Poaceae TaxID=4479 RepID=A0A3L6QPA0_PANMI|nr:uncharacterized protein C2845_PM04G19910 [Panicum miliaceum]
MSVRIKAVVDRFVKELQEALDADIQDRIMKEREMQSYIEEREREVAEREAAWKAELSRREGSIEKRLYDCSKAEIARQEARLKIEKENLEKEKSVLMGTASSQDNQDGALEITVSGEKYRQNTIRSGGSIWQLENQQKAALLSGRAHRPARPRGLCAIQLLGNARPRKTPKHPWIGCLIATGMTPEEGGVRAGAARAWAARRLWGGRRAALPLRVKAAARYEYDSASYARNFDDGTWMAEEGVSWHARSLAACRLAAVQ